MKNIPVIELKENSTSYTNYRMILIYYERKVDLHEQPFRFKLSVNHLKLFPFIYTRNSNCDGVIQIVLTKAFINQIEKFLYFIHKVNV